MAIYKNDYTKKEDKALWELHEIRYRLHKELRVKSVGQINIDALRKFKNWKSQKDKISAVR